MAQGVGRQRTWALELLAVLLVALPSAHAALADVTGQVSSAMGLAWSLIGALFNFNLTPQLQAGVLKFFVFIMILRVVQNALHKHGPKFDNKTAGVIGFVIAAITVLFTPSTWLIASSVAVLIPLALIGYLIWVAMHDLKDDFLKNLFGVMLLIVTFLINSFAINMFERWQPFAGQSANTFGATTGLGQFVLLIFGITGGLIIICLLIKLWQMISHGGTGVGRNFSVLGGGGNGPSFTRGMSAMGRGIKDFFTRKKKEDTVKDSAHPGGAPEKGERLKDLHDTIRHFRSTTEEKETKQEHKTERWNRLMDTISGWRKTPEEREAIEQRKRFVSKIRAEELGRVLAARYAYKQAKAAARGATGVEKERRKAAEKTAKLALKAAEADAKADVKKAKIAASAGRKSIGEFLSEYFSRHPETANPDETTEPSVESVTETYHDLIVNLYQLQDPMGDVRNVEKLQKIPLNKDLLWKVHVPDSSRPNFEIQSEHGQIIIPWKDVEAYRGSTIRVQAVQGVYFISGPGITSGEPQTEFSIEVTEEVLKGYSSHVVIWEKPRTTPLQKMSAMAAFSVFKVNGTGGIGDSAVNDTPFNWEASMEGSHKLLGEGSNATNKIEIFIPDTSIFDESSRVTFTITKPAALFFASPPLDPKPYAAPESRRLKKSCTLTLPLRVIEAKRITYLFVQEEVSKVTPTEAKIFEKEIARIDEMLSRVDEHDSLAWHTREDIEVFTEISNMLHSYNQVHGSSNPARYKLLDQMSIDALDFATTYKSVHSLETREAAIASLDGPRFLGGKKRAYLEMVKQTLLNIQKSQQVTEAIENHV